MNIRQWAKKGLLLSILACSFLSFSSYAVYNWNRHYTRCYNGYCTHYQYHRYCNNGHCWTHEYRHNWRN